jgi:putative transposase
VSASLDNQERDQTTKGKRHTTEEKFRAFMEADGGRPIREECQERNILEATYHRWRKQFGMKEVDEAKRLKELELERERENSEPKKMLAESLLKNRVLEAVCEKSSEPGDAPGTREAADRGGGLLDPGWVPDAEACPVDLEVPWKGAERAGEGAAPPSGGAVGQTPAIWLPADRGDASAGRLGGGQAPGATMASKGRPEGAADAPKACEARCFDRTAYAGPAPWACVDVEFHRGCHREG